jgi:hypothetical protein
MKEPKIIDNVLSDLEFKTLESYFINKEKTKDTYDNFFGRYLISDPILSDYSEKILPIAREFFEDDTLLTSYSLFSHYSGENPKLRAHVDDNACTYTIDLCLYQKDPWDLWVEGRPYTLFPNQALAYYGNDNIHWRKEFPNKDSNFVAMIFFHFVKPDHWWFTKGPDYLSVIKNEISEEEWLSKKNNNRLM